MPFQKGDKIRHRRTGKTATVTRFDPSCGNVYIGGGAEITVANWEKVPEKTAPEPQPVANGNGHGAEVPPLHAFERPKERVG